MECAICQEELINYVAKPTGCSHYFHEYCLSKWKFKSCPSCRSKYDVFEVVDVVKNIVLTRISAMSPNREDLAAIQDDFPVGIPDPFNDLVCDVCNSGDDENTLLICEGCLKGVHARCVNLSRVPRGSWYCVGCEPVLRPPPPQERHRHRRPARNFIYDGHDSDNNEGTEESELEDEFDEEDSDRSQASMGSFIDDREATDDEEDTILASDVMNLLLPTVGRRARGSARRGSSTARGGARTGARRRRTTTRRTRRTRRTGARGGRRRRTRRTSDARTTSGTRLGREDNGAEEDIDLMDVLPTIREEVEEKPVIIRTVTDSYDLLGEILPQQEIALTPGHLLKIEGEKLVPRPEWSSYIEKKRNRTEKSQHIGFIRALPPPPAHVFTVTLNNGVQSNKSGQTVENDSRNQSTSSNTSRPSSSEERKTTTSAKDDSIATTSSHRDRARSPPTKRKRSKSPSAKSSSRKDASSIAAAEHNSNRPSTSRETHNGDDSSKKDRRRDRDSDARKDDERRHHKDARKHHHPRDSTAPGPERESRSNENKNGDIRQRSPRNDRKNHSREKSSSRSRLPVEQPVPREKPNGDRKSSDERRRRHSHSKEKSIDAPSDNQSRTKNEERKLHELAMIQIALSQEQAQAEQQHLLALNQMALQANMSSEGTREQQRLEAETMRKEKQELINFYDNIGKSEMKKLFQAKRITGDQYKNAMRLIVEKCRAKAVPLNNEEQVRQICRKVREKILRPAKSPS